MSTFTNLFNFDFLNYIQMEQLIIGAIVLLVGILLVLIPTRAWAALLKPISFGKFGVRYIRSRRDNTDTLANFMYFLTVVLCVAFIFIPYFHIVIGIWLTFAFLATFGQAARVGLTLNVFKAKIVLFGVYLMYVSGMAAAVGLVNQFAIISDVSIFFKAIADGNYLNYVFYLTEPYAMDILLEAVIIFFASYNLWAQYKYMRLEDTFKARWIGTYFIKVVFVSAIIFALGFGGFKFIDFVFQIDSSIV